VRTQSVPHLGRRLAGWLGGAGCSRHEWRLTTPNGDMAPAVATAGVDRGCMRTSLPTMPAHNSANSA